MIEFLEKQCYSVVYELNLTVSETDGIKICVSFYVNCLYANLVELNNERGNIRVPELTHMRSKDLSLHSATSRGTHNRHAMRMTWQDQGGTIGGH